MSGMHLPMRGPAWRGGSLRVLARIVDTRIGRDVVIAVMRFTSGISRLPRGD